jgi:NADPH2:quinone reductase
MRAVTVPEPGGPEVLTLTDLPEPVPGPGQVLVRVAAAGVNFIDVYERSGAYATPTPFTLGKEGAGEVLGVGPQVSGVQAGDHVAWKDAPGSYAELVAVPAAEVVPVPAGLSDETAAAAMLQGLTAHYLCSDTYPVAPGDWVLVHAAAGGVGLLLTQLVRLRGGRVIATTGGGQKTEFARRAGAELAVGYDEAVHAVREATGGAGVTAVYDGVGAATFESSLRALSRRGVLVLYGAASGPVPPFDLQRLRPGSRYVTRPNLGDYTHTRAELLARCSQVLGAAADGSLQVRVGHRYPLGEARQAHEDLAARRTTGKLLLVP